MVSPPPQYLALILQNGAKIARGLSQCFVERLPTWHGPDFTCNFPQTVLRPTETDQSQIYPKFWGQNLALF